MYQNGTSIYLDFPSFTKYTFYFNLSVTLLTISYFILLIKPQGSRMFVYSLGSKKLENQQFSKFNMFLV